MGQVQHGGPEEDAEDEQEDDFGHRDETTEELGHQGRQHRGDRNERQRGYGGLGHALRLSPIVAPVATNRRPRYAARCGGCQHLGGAAGGSRRGSRVVSRRGGSL